MRPLVHLKSSVKVKEVGLNFTLEEASYADIDGDGTPDGVIYADLAVGSNGEKQGLTNSNNKYTIPKSVTNPKTYTISQESYSGSFGTGPVLKASGTGDQRYYIMALTDFDSTTHTWYKNAVRNMSDYSTYTSPDFGQGKNNTTKMITKWKANGYGTGDSGDIWSVIQTKVSQGWFVPSQEEWSAFAGELGITTSNYFGKGLSGNYWSSSQEGVSSASYIHLDFSIAPDEYVNCNYYVRLGTTF